MGRKILAVVVASIVAFAIISIVQMGRSMVVMPPSQEVLNDPAKFREFVANLPMTALVVVLVGYIVASFAGGFIATKMARHVGGGFVETIIVAAILELSAILNFFVLVPGQPMWFVVAALSCFVPVALLGHRLAR